MVWFPNSIRWHDVAIPREERPCDRHIRHGQEGGGSDLDDDARSRGCDGRSGWNRTIGHRKARSAEAELARIEQRAVIVDNLVRSNDCVLAECWAAKSPGQCQGEKFSEGTP